MKFTIEGCVDLKMISKDEDQWDSTCGMIHEKIETLCNILTLKMWMLDETTLYNFIGYDHKKFFVFARTLDSTGREDTYWQYNAYDLPNNVKNALEKLNDEEICLKDELVKLDKIGFPIDALSHGRCFQMDDKKKIHLVKLMKSKAPQEDFHRSTLVQQVIGMYGHDGYDAETTASILGVPLKTVEEIIEENAIVPGEF